MNPQTNAGDFFRSRIAWCAASFCPMQAITPQAFGCTTTSPRPTPTLKSGPLAAAFPWPSRPSGLAAGRQSAWLCRIRPGPVYAGSTARVRYAGVATNVSFDTQRGIRHGCPSSVSVWALPFDLVVRVLRMHMAGPRDDFSVFADDTSATIAEVIAYLLALLHFFDGRRGVGDQLRQYFVNYSPLPGFALKRRLLDAIGVAQMVVARSAVCLGAPYRP